MATVDINLGRYILKPFVVLSTGDVDITTAPATINSVTLVSGDRVFLIGQSTATQNGGYVFNGAGSAMTRTTDLASGAVIKSGTVFNVLLGKPHKQICFQIHATSDEKADITIGTTAFTYRFLNDGKISYAGYVPAASGLQADATDLLSTHNVILLGGDDYSVKVPLNSAFQYLIVNNYRNFTLKVFPSSGGTLGAGVDTAITLEPYEIIYLLGVGDIGLGQQWVVYNPVSQTINAGTYHKAPSEDAVRAALDAIELTAVSDYMFTGTNSDIAGYESMVALSDYTAAAEQNNGGTAASTTPAIMEEFATNMGYPNLIVIPIGNIHCHYETQKSAGSNNYYTYFEVYKRVLAGTETLLLTSDNSSYISANTRQQITLSAYNSAPITLLETDRIVIKVYVVMASATATVTLYWDDNTNARMELPTSLTDLNITYDMLPEESELATITAFRVLTGNI